MAKEPYTRVPSQEMMLLDLVQRLDKFRQGRMAVHVHLALLSDSFKKPRFIRLATDHFSALVGGLEGHLFQLVNSDLFFIAKEVAPAVLQAAVFRLASLFAQDPLVDIEIVAGGERFCSWYDLEHDYDTLNADVRSLVRANSILAADSRLRQLTGGEDCFPIKPEVLSRIERVIATTDVSNIVRRQTVCTLIENEAPMPLFEELFVSIQDLQEVIAPEVDLGGNTWLFRYLTQALDHRVMMMLVRDGVTGALPFSLNLNVETVLSADFARFEAAVASQLRGRLVIEMNKLDVFSDMGAFLFARDYLHDRGFRLCLDGVTHRTLPYYNRSSLGFDLIKLYWTPDALDVMRPSAVPEIRRLVMDSGQAHTILCRCDDAHAIEVGRDLGVVMFQGREVDRLLALPRTMARIVS